MTYNKIRVDAGHRMGITGLADSDNPSIADAEIGFDDTDFGVDYGRVLNHKIERFVGILGGGAIALAVAKSFSSSDQELMTVDRVVLFNLSEETGITQPHQIARSRPKKPCVFGPADRSHRRSGPQIAH